MVTKVSNRDRQTEAAWAEYLQTTRDAAAANQFTYHEVEEWAWARLNDRLKTIRKREATAHE